MLAFFAISDEYMKILYWNEKRQTEFEINRKEYEFKMQKTENSLSKFAKYTLFNVMSMIGLSCYILADTYFISNGLGADGLTALNLAIPVYSFVNGCGLMLGVGGATKYAIFRAQKQREEGNRIFMNMIYAALALAFVFVLLALLVSEQLTYFLGADEQVFSMTNIYIKMILLFSPAFLLNNVINCFVRNDGNPGLSMAAMLAGSFLNILMDYIFIFPMGLGMFGAVLATGFAPIAGLLVLSIHFIKNQNGFGFCRDSISLGRMVSSMSIGVPSFVTEVSAGIVMIIFNLLILGLAGNVGVAAYGVVANIAIVVLSIYNGIAQGMQPVVSDSFGKGEYAETGKVLRYGMITMFMVSVVMYIFLFAKANEVALLFNRDRDMVLQQIAITGIRLYFAAIPVAGFNIVLSSYFASVEKAVPAQVIALLRGIILVIPIVFVMAHVWELTGVWLSFAVTEMITVFVGIGLFMKDKKSR